jgi:phenylpropionate dioxygenase-like ring-hydroxylating dioxygenase large terminal subunit
MVVPAAVLAASPVLIAGGPDPDRFDPAQAWYPIHYLQDLDRTQLLPFTLLDQDLVIWWDGTQWRANSDQCPHRLAALSEGRVNAQGQLECPYHGWTFDSAGQCTSIPQQDPGTAANTSQRACLRTYPTAEAQGLLFVYAGNPDQAAAVPIPIIQPVEQEPEGWTWMETFRDLPYDALTLLENVLDASHLPYTHHNTVGKRENAAPMLLEVLESGKAGFRGTWPEGPRRGKLGTQDTTFVAPNLMWHDLTSKQFGRTLTVVYATPISKGKCRLFARFPFKFPSKIPALAIGLTPRWYSHLGQNKILEDDQIFLHAQERYLAAAGGGEQFSKAFYMPAKADRFVFEYRQWLNQFEADPFPGQALPPKIESKAQLLDRYHSHTQHCQSCSRALKWVKILRSAAAIAAFITLSLLLNGLIAVASGGGAIALCCAFLGGTLVLGALWRWLNQLERQFTEGQAIPPRNLPARPK